MWRRSIRAGFPASALRYSDGVECMSGCRGWGDLHPSGKSIYDMHSQVSYSPAVCGWVIGGKGPPTAMVIGFETRQLRQLCESRKLLESKFGVQGASFVRARLADLQAATSLQEVLNLGLLKTSDSLVCGAIRLHGQGLAMVLKPVWALQSGENAADSEHVTRVKILSIELNNA